MTEKMFCDGCQKEIELPGFALTEFMYEKDEDTKLAKVPTDYNNLHFCNEGCLLDWADRKKQVLLLTAGTPQG